MGEIFVREKKVREIETLRVVGYDVGLINMKEVFGLCSYYENSFLYFIKFI